MKEIHFFRHMMLARVRAAMLPMDPEWVQFEAAEHALLQIAEAEVAPGVFTVKINGRERFYAVEGNGDLHELERK